DNGWRPEIDRHDVGIGASLTRLHELLQADQEDRPPDGAMGKHRCLIVPIGVPKVEISTFPFRNYLEFDRGIRPFGKPLVGRLPPNQFIGLKGISGLLGLAGEPSGPPIRDTADSVDHVFRRDLPMSHYLLDLEGSRRSTPKAQSRSMPLALAR